MFSNAAIAGLLASAYFMAVVLHLNPSYPLTIGAVSSLALTLSLAYGAILTVVFSAAVVARQLAAAEVLSPGWVSVRLLSWLCTTAAAAGAALMWLNLRGFADVLAPPAVTRMTAGALAMTASAIVFLLIALAQWGRRRPPYTAAILAAMMAISVAAPLTARGVRGEEPLGSRPIAPLAVLDAPRADSRVIVLMLDGASLDVISPAVAEGRLPNIGRIFDNGAVLQLATLRPTQPEPVWSAIATGRLPMANGIRASALYRVRPSGPALELLPDYCFSQMLVRFGFLAEEPHTAASLRSRPIWSILNGAGVDVGLVGWPLTHPAPEVNGVIVSDRFHQMDDADATADASGSVGPPAMLPAVRSALRFQPDPDPLTLIASSPQLPVASADGGRDPAPIVADRVHLQLLRSVPALAEARFLAVRFPGIDAVGHYFLRFADPSAFGDVSEAERRRLGRVLDDYYGFIDALVGSMLKTLRPDDLLLVLSAFGMEPLSPGKRVLEQVVGNDRLSGTHERAPDGFLLAYGAAVAPTRPARASVLDVTPTVLYYLGLPVGRDMDGFARTDLFRPAFTASHPITFIPTYGR
jgi:hypothetical protein